MAQIDVDVAAKTRAVTRIRLTGVTPTEHHMLTGVDGVSRTKLGADVLLPPDPMLIDDVIDRVPTVRLSDAATQWYKAYNSRYTSSLGIAKMDDVNDVDPAPWAGQLYPFQRVGAAWLRHVGRGILGDDPGLGKTIQALTAARDQRRVLITTLGGVKDHWARHVTEWLHHDVGVCVGTHAERQKIIDDGHDWLIINHEMLRPGPAAYRGLDRRWDVVIIDEAHKFQGRKSQQSKGITKLIADQMYQLTGTPIWNRPDSLWSLLHLIDPVRFGSYWRFVNMYCDVQQTQWGTKVVGVNYQTIRRLQSTLTPLLLRRQKKDVAPWLPDKIYETVTYDIGPQQRRAYQKVKTRLSLQTADGVTLKNYPSVVTSLADMRLLIDSPDIVGMRLASSAEHPKDGVIDSLLDSLLDDDGHRKVVVYCWHRRYAAYLAERLASNGRAVTLVTGETPDKTIALDAFKKGGDQVLVATIAAVGTGIDLTECTAAIFAEGSYVNVENTQAEDRLHRIGTKDSPLIYRLQARNTVEEVIWQNSDDTGQTSDDVLTVGQVARLTLKTD